MAATFIGTQATGNIRPLNPAMMTLYSRSIQYEAMGAMHFAAFAEYKTDFLKNKGETIVFTVYKNLQRGGRLSETIRLQERSMESEQAQITVTEYGNAVGVTEKASQMTDEALIADASILLGRDYTLVTDLMLRDAVYGTTNITYADGALDRTSMTANSILTTDDVDKVVADLQTRNVVQFPDASNGDFYVAAVHPQQIKDLRHDPSWQATQQYANTRALFTGEVGRWNSVVFVQTSHVPNGACGATDPGYEAALVNGASGTMDVYRSVFFGLGAYGWAVALPVELRARQYDDYGRFHGVAWYSIMGAGLLNNDNAQVLETVVS